MGKHGTNEPWRKFKRSISYLSLAGKATNPADSNLTTKIKPKEAACDLDDSSSFDTDHEATPLFSSPSVADMDLNFQAWVDSDVRPLALVRAQDDSCDPPPRSKKRQSVGSMPTRKHPYPSKFSSALNACNAVTHPSGLRQMLFNSSHGRRRSAVYRKKITDSSFALQKRNRGFKGLSKKLRRCFSFRALRSKKLEQEESEVEKQEPEASSRDSSSSDVSRCDSTVVESLFSRIMRVARSLDFDESTVGSLIIILGEDEPQNK